MIPRADNLASLVVYLPEIMTAFMAVFFLMVDAFIPRARRYTAYFAAVGLLILMRLTASLGDAGRMEAFGGAVVTDAWANYFRLILLLSGALILIVAERGLERIGRSRQGEVTASILFALSGMMTLAVSQDLLVTFIAIEVFSLSIYPMILLGGDGRSAEAALKYLILGGVASAVGLLGMAYIFGAAGSTRYIAIGATAYGANSVGTPLFLVGIILVFVAFAYKIAAAPFHAWLPDAYEGAPTIITAFMASCVKCAAFAGLGRFALVISTMPFFRDHMGMILVVISALTMTLGNFAALVQGSFKRLLAYSAIAHTGYVMMGLAALVYKGRIGGLAASGYYLAAYAVMTLAAFIALSAVEGRNGKGESLGALDGLGRERPWLSAAITIVLAGLAGLPPTIGFFGKLRLLSSALDAGLVGITIIAIVNSLIAAYYYLAPLERIYGRSGTEGGSGVRGGILAVVVIVLALVVLAGGIYEPLTLLAYGAAGGFLR